MMAQRKGKKGSKKPQNKAEELLQNPEALAGQMEQIVKSCIVEGKPLQHALGVSAETMETVYSLAYTYYNQGKIEEATGLFRYLYSLNGFVFKYALGLGACLQFQKDYLGAVQVYMGAAIVEPKDPSPFFHAAEASACLGDPLSAETFLETALKRISENGNDHPLKERCIAMKKGLRDLMTEEPKKENKGS